MAERKLTPTQVARLGGLARAQRLNPDKRRTIASMGAQTFYERYGEEGLERMRLGLKVKR